MNIKTHEVQAFRKSPELAQMRSQLLRDEWPESCENCRTEEKAGLVSRRTTEARRWSSRFSEARAREVTDSAGYLQSTVPPVLGLELRLGTKCNLKCRMCHPRSSSAWYEDFVAIEGSHYQEYGREIQIVRTPEGQFETRNISYDWPSIGESWDRLDPILGELSYIYISGGEPLLIEEHFILLDKLIALGRANQVRIEMASNLTVLPQRAIDKWLEFGGVGLSASFDGVGRVNDYIRFPSRWETVEKNFMKLNSIGAPIDLWIQPTVQALNILSMPQMYEWRMDFELNSPLRTGYKDVIVPHLLRDPKYLTLQVFPHPMKERIAEHLTAATVRLESLAKGRPSGERIVEAYKTFAVAAIEFMWSGDETQEFKTFLAITEKLDQLRGQRINRDLPELAALLRGDAKELVASEY